jgi:hypothetical protein
MTSKKHEPRTAAAQMIETPEMPGGAGERFGGYGVMGLPFTSGDYLALRHFTATSIGPAYRAVWHRDPDRRWTIYADAPPEVSCARYFGSALRQATTTPIEIAWADASSLTVEIAGVLRWRIDIAADPATRLMSAFGAVLPAGAAQAPWLLRPMSRMAGPMLSVGRVRMAGTVPNGQSFGAIPRRVWGIPTSEAVIRGEDIGPTGPLPAQDHLGDFWLPQRGIFYADGAAAFGRSTTAQIFAGPEPRWAAGSR